MAKMVYQFINLLVVFICISTIGFGQVKSGKYSFHYITIDEYNTTVPNNGGTALYNADGTGQYEEGEIEVNFEKKIFILKYTGDQKEIYKAIIDGEPTFNKFFESYKYKAHWEDSKEKTEIEIAYTNSLREVSIPFGPHKGQYADYWDKIIHYGVQLNK